MDPKEKDVEDEYLSSLMDLNVNSKPLINMLTMLAEDNLECAHVIVGAIEKHITQVAADAKLPILYLIDSIVKNVGKKYKQLFSQNIVKIFCEVFQKVNEKVRERMFNLRQTWNEIFPQPKLYTLDVKVNMIDPNWPITAKVVPKVPKVHINPKFMPKGDEKGAIPQVVVQAAKAVSDSNLEELQAKERELMELKKRKIELELIVTKKKVMEKEKEIQQHFGVPPPVLASGPPPHMQNMPPHRMMNHGKIRIAPVNPAMMSSTMNRPRDPRLEKMQNQSNMHPKVPQQMSSFPVMPQVNIRGLPRIPKHSKSSSSSTSRSDRDESRKRRSDDTEEKSSSSRHRSKSSSSSSSSKSSPTKKSNHESSRKKDDDRKSSKSSSSHKSSRSHSSSSKSSPSKASDDAPKDVDLRVVHKGDIDMRPDSTTVVTADNKVNKNKLLNDLLHDEDMRSSQDSMISTSNDNEDSSQSEQLPKCDTDLRFTDQGKKRSMSGEPSDAEPSPKKNKVDILFGNEDVDLRAPGVEAQPVPEKKPKADKSSLDEIRRKLVTSKARNKLNSIKLLDEPPNVISPIENGKSEIAKKIYQKAKDVKEQEEASNNQMDQEHANPPQRKEKRKESKWSQPTVVPTPSVPWINPSAPIRMPLPTNAQVPGMMMPHHFVNPWETNPMVIAMQKASQIPLVLPQSVHQLVLNNKMRTLRLDGVRDHLLRFYGEVAIIFNESGHANDIRFSHGQSKVVIDDMYSVTLEFNDSYKPIVIEGVQYQIKFGKPTRELYIDDNFYECYFNNQPTHILLGDKVRRVRIEGKAPEVKIGEPRRDLVLGRINMAVDAELMIPVFLDTTIQYFEYKGQIFTLQFADFFLSVVINNEPFKVEFGGLPKNFMLNGQKHFIRFTMIPDDISPGHVNLRGMRRTNLFRNCKSPPIIEPRQFESPQVNINELIENDMGMQQMPPAIPIQTPQQPPVDQGSMNISELLQKLVATGIIGNAQPPTTSAPTPVVSKPTPVPQIIQKEPVIKPAEEPTVRIIPVNLARPETIKMRQQAIVDTLYIGSQCGNCGLRFPPEQTIRYSQHLDWHFRQNRRERDSKRKAQSRRWYYNRSDWIKYEEIEDAEEREKNFFETQQMEAMDQGEDSNAGRAINIESSCPAGPEDVNRICDMCHDQFDQFFNEETEEWHLKSAIKVEDKFFHPICYEDYKASLTLDESAIASDNTTQANDEEMLENNDSVVIIKEEKPDDVVRNTEINPDDDDVIVLPPEEPVITEIPDENEENEQEATDQTLNATDDDVMIQEPKIQVYDVEQSDNLTEIEFTHQPVTIKEEPKDDGYGDLINEEDAFVEVTSINENDETHSPFHPSTLDENAIFDDSSLMMMSSNVADDQHLSDDGNSRPDSQSAPAIVGGTKRLKIVLSSAALVQQSNLKNSNVNNLNNVTDQTETSSNFESVNKLDSNSLADLQKEGATTAIGVDDVRPEEKELAYDVKPHLQDFKFERNSVPVKRGYENSGLCSIM